MFLSHLATNISPQIYLFSKSISHKFCQWEHIFLGEEEKITLQGARCSSQGGRKSIENSEGAQCPPHEGQQALSPTGHILLCCPVHPGQQPLLQAGKVPSGVPRTRHWKGLVPCFIQVTHHTSRGPHACPAASLPHPVPVIVPPYKRGLEVSGT